MSETRWLPLLSQCCHSHGEVLAPGSPGLRQTNKSQHSLHRELDRITENIRNGRRLPDLPDKKTLEVEQNKHIEIDDSGYSSLVLSKYRQPCEAEDWFSGSGQLVYK